MVDATCRSSFFQLHARQMRTSHAQSGWFSVVRLEHELEEIQSMESLDAQIASILDHVPTEPILRKYTLPLSESRRLLWLLAVRGINAASVFPDYRGAAAAVCEWRLYDRSV